MSKEKNNLTIKAFALIIAILLWNTVMKTENPEWETTIKNVPVTINTSALDRLGLQLMEPKDITVNVETTGRKSDYKEFSSKNIVAQLDLTGRGEGQYKVAINVSLINQLPGVVVKNIEPKEVLFTLEKIVTKDISINFETEGELSTNYMLGDITSKSQFVTVRGPRSWVNEVNKVVAIVNVQGMIVDTKRSVNVKILDDQGNEVIGVEKVPGVIDLSVSILKTNSVPIELITENELPENFTITNIAINPRTIAIKGKNDSTNIEKINTKAIDINSLLEQSSMEVELDLPKGVELLDPKEKIVITYTIEETVIMDYNILLRDVTIKNLNSSLRIDNNDLDTPIKISLKGIKSKIDLITKEDLILEIDALNLDEGIHPLELKVGTIQGITVEEIKPELLEIRLISY